MNFKFINKEGEEVKISSLGSFIELVKTGQIKDDTLLYAEQDSKWKKASEFEEFQAILRNLEKSNNERTSVIHELKVNTRDRRKKLILVSILLILAGIVLLLIVSAKYYPNAKLLGFANEFPEFLVYYLFIITPSSYLIWRFFLNKMKGGFVLTFSLLFLVSSGYQSGKMLKETHRAKKEIQQAQNVIKDTNATIKDFLAGKEINQKNYTSQPQSKLAPISIWSNNYLLSIQQYQKEYTKAIENLQIENILLPTTLSNPDKIADAKLRLKKAIQLIDNFEKFYEEKLAETFAELNSLDVEDNLKKIAIESFNRGKKRSDQFLKEYLMVERSFVAEMNNLLDFLNSLYGKYWFEGDQIFFATEEDATQYNNYIQKINHLALEEALLLNKWQDINAQLFEKLLQFENLSQ